MTEAEIKRALNLVRYGGVVITVTVFVALVAFSLIVGNAVGGAFGMSGEASSNTFNQLLPYTIGFTVMAAVLSIVLFFGYRAYLMGKLKK